MLSDKEVHAQRQAQCTMEIGNRMDTVYAALAHIFNE